MKFFTIILFLYLSIIKNFNYDSIIYKLKVTERYETILELLRVEKFNKGSWHKLYTDFKLYSI